ncbi:hypothetical protein [Acetobacterium woodii]
MKRRVNGESVQREPGKVQAGGRKNIEDGLGVSCGEALSRDRLTR